MKVAFRSSALARSPAFTVALEPIIRNPGDLLVELAGILSLIARRDAVDHHHECTAASGRRVREVARECPYAVDESALAAEFVLQSHAVESLFKRPLLARLGHRFDEGIRHRLFRHRCKPAGERPGRYQVLAAQA